LSQNFQYMTKIFETSAIRDIEKYTIDNEPVTCADLVDRAATVFVNEFRRQYPVGQGRIYVFAGPGNNGADALAVAQQLQDFSYTVSTYLINPKNALSPECEICKQRIKEDSNHNFTEVVSSFNAPTFEPQDIVIDGLFGTGLKRPLEGGFAAIVSYINKNASTIVSIDLPSGLFGEDNTGNTFENIIQADLTLTFEFPRLAFLLPESSLFASKWQVLPINLHPEAIAATQTPYVIFNYDDIIDLLKPRDRFAHKGDFGHALLLAGSAGKIGAAVLAAKGCLRSGAGLLTVHLPSRGETAMTVALPEAMTDADKNADYITELPDISRYNAIAIGPGIGKDKETKAVLEGLLAEAKGKNLVIDADALNIIADNSELLHALPEKSILTPHPGEFDRLVGSKSASAYERLQKARSIAAEYKIYIVLKGAYTAICTPKGKVLFNTTGNPGMATAGSGDVLTGIITGLLAQNYQPAEAAKIGVYLHGLAADIAAAQLSQESMLATDIIENLGKAYRFTKKIAEL